MKRMKRNNLDQKKYNRMNAVGKMFADVKRAINGERKGRK